MDNENVEKSGFADAGEFWGALIADVTREDNFPSVRPLLAHYCSTTTLEAILKNEELWFSNPMFMNDHEEMRFGVLKGMTAFDECEEIKTALASNDRYTLFRNAMHAEFSRFDSERALEVFACCLSEHSDEDDDGLLSMWRGYGDNGNGAAIVFDTSKLTYVEGSPLIVSKVTYGTIEQRIEYLRKFMLTCADSLVRLNVQTDGLPYAANLLFERILIFALFTKHKGFHEEREWRVVYLPHHDRNQKLKNSIGYHVGPGGIQPKLKFKVAPVNEVAGNHQTLATLVHKIILGPTGAAPLKRATTQMMLRNLDKPNLADLVVVSGTPFRPA